MESRDVWIVGHKNPDTDSICSAISYAYLKNEVASRTEEDGGGCRFLPKRSGAVSAETKYVLEYFNHSAPELITDVGTQIKDIAIRRTEGVSSHISMKKAWEMMKILRVVTLPVVNEKNKLEGLIVNGDIARSYMDVYENSILSKARTQYRNIVETLGGKIVTGNEHGYFVNGKVVVAAGSKNVLTERLERDDLVIVGDSFELQMTALRADCSCIIITDGSEVEKDLIEAADQREVIIISTPYDTYTTARLINQSMPIKFFMTKENITHFGLDDYVDEVRDVMSKIRHRDFPILDENQNYVGMFSRRNLMNTRKKQIILVDHNERSQAVENIDEAEILEIIDHHRVGSLETIAPVYFRNQPLGCTATIIYQMYQEQQVEIPPDIAGLLCAAILSDTLMFRSPTCTQVDRDTAKNLAMIAGIEVESFAQKMFEAGSDFENKTAEEILSQDFKIFHSGEVSFGVSQVSAMSRSELDRVKTRIQPILQKIRTDKSLTMVYVMLTDILNESTVLVCEGHEAAAIASMAFRLPVSADEVLLKGVVSRKKQLIPSLINALADRS